MRTLRPVIVLLLVAALAGMAGCTNHRRSDSLTETLNSYAGTLRWSGFKQALGFIDPEYLKAHPLTELQIQRYQQVRVAGYDEGNGPIPAGPDEVRQVVRISLINRNTQRERDVIDRQTWRWDEKAGRWWLTSGLPEISRSAEPD